MGKATGLKLIILLSLALAVVLLPGLAFAEGGQLEGSGTPNDPYKISNYGDLKTFAGIVNDGDAEACAVLTADIVATGGDWDTPIGDNLSNSYAGTFDGCGCAIKGLSTPENCSDNHIGLFGRVGGAGIVKNVGLEGGVIRSTGNSVGGVAGNNNGSVMNCYNTGEVFGGSPSGGVVGGNSGSMTCCYNTGKVSGSGGSMQVGGVAGGNIGSVTCCYNMGEVSGGGLVGGVIGRNHSKGDPNRSGIIASCYNTGKVSGSMYVGGVAGYNSSDETVMNGSVTNCYSTGELSGDTGVGGVVGHNLCKVSYSYFNSQKAPGIPAVGGLTGTDIVTSVSGLTTGQMSGSDALTHMAFKYEGEESPWLARDSDSQYFFYPHLKGFDFAKDGQRVEFPAGVAGGGVQMAAADIPTESWPPKEKRTEMTITVKDQSYVYNGSPQGEGDPAYDDPAAIGAKVKVEGLRSGDRIASLTLTGQATEAGEYPGLIEVTGFAVVDDGGNDAAHTYDDTCVAGKLTIESANYTVRFVDGQGKTLKTEKVESGKAATAPADPKRSGYTFAGWDKDFSTVTGDMTVTAQWKKAAPAVGGTLLAKVTAKGSDALVLKWTKVKGADGYDVFFSPCGKESPKKVKTIKGNRAHKWTKRSLEAKRPYKVVVKAYVMKDGEKSYVRTSPTVHAYTSGGTGKYTNSKGVTVKRASVSLKAGETCKIKASVTKLDKGKKLMPAAHAPKLRYVSTNKKVATVSRSGKVTAKGKGSCKVYAIAVNGARKAVKVTVG